MQMMDATLCTNSILGEMQLLAEEVLLSNSEEEEVEYLMEINILRLMSEECIRPVWEYYLQKEMEMCDVPDEVNDERYEYGPPRKRTIDSFTEYEALTFTNFRKVELRRIFDCFGFGYGNIRVSCYENDDYLFHGQELFLFGLVKMATGLDTSKLCHLFFGGAPRRWSSGYKWFLTTLYEKYYPRVLGMEGLVRETSNFGYYAQKICNRFNQERFYINNNTYEREDIESTTLPPHLFNIFSFIDGSITETYTHGTGPNGDYIGSMRKNDDDDLQRAIYSGYKKLHGLSTLVIMLPNGIHFIYGPCSMRHTDLSMINMANLDQFLFDMQIMHGDGRVYRSYGDRLFRISQCITRAHEGDLLNPLTDQEHLENSGMKAVRVSIENNFSIVANKWTVCTHFDSFKLGGDNPHAKEQLAICYLLSNISLCLHGGQVGGLNTFLCVPPSLEEYLAI